MSQPNLEAELIKALSALTNSLPEKESQAMIDAKREETDALNLYKQCIEIRNFEIQNLVNRNNFFMVFQGVLMAGVIQGSKDAPNGIIILASLCGFLISLFQVGMSQGAKYWQEAWEYRLARAELRLENAFDAVRVTLKPNTDAMGQELIDATKTAASWRLARQLSRNEAVNSSLEDHVPAYPRGFAHLFSRSDKETQIEVEKSLRLSESNYNFLIKRRSVSKIPIYSGIVFCIIWVAIYIHMNLYPVK